MLEVNDWIIINSLTYKIHFIDDTDEMRETIMKQIGDIISFDSASFYVTKSLSCKELEKPLGINYSREDMMDYLTVFKDVDYSKGLMTTGKNIVYRESDIISNSVRVNSEYYRKVYTSHNWHYSLHLNISCNEEFLGVLSFFRNRDKNDFQYRDVFALDMIKDHLALRLYRDAKNRELGKFSVTELSREVNLTSRETGILEHLIKAESITEISTRLSIAETTVKKHIANIYKKSGVISRVQLLNLIREE